MRVKSQISRSTTATSLLPLFAVPLRCVVSSVPAAWMRKDPVSNYRSSLCRCQIFARGPSALRDTRLVTSVHITSPRSRKGEPRHALRAGWFIVLPAQHLAVLRPTTRVAKILRKDCRKKSLGKRRLENWLSNWPKPASLSAAWNIASSTQGDTEKLDLAIETRIVSGWEDRKRREVGPFCQIGCGQDWPL